MKRIAAVLGDYYHDGAWSEHALMEALREEINSGAVQLAIIDYTSLGAALAERPDAVILFKEDRLIPEQDPDARWLTSELSDSIEQFVVEGGAWLAWHSGLASYPRDSAYIQMLRGSFLTHPPVHQPVTYAPTDAALDLTNGRTFTLLDEHYLVDCDEANSEVFLRSSSIDGASIAGWRHRYGEGRVCALTPAHRQEGLLDRSFLIVLRNCVRWCLNLNDESA